METKQHERILQFLDAYQFAPLSVREFQEDVHLLHWMSQTIRDLAIFLKIDRGASLSFITSELKKDYRYAATFKDESD